MSSRLRNIFFFVGVAAIILMCFTFDVSFSQLWTNIQRAGYWLIAIILLWGGLYAMNALTWRVVIFGSGDCPLSFWRLYKLTVTGFALNYATPVGLLGGEPYKIMEATPLLGAQRATSSVVLFSMMHIFSHFWFWVTSIVVYVILAAFGVLSMNVGMAVVLLLMSLFCVGGVYLFSIGYRNGMVVRLIHFVGKIPGLRSWANRFADNHREDLQKIDQQISQLHSQNRRHFYLSLMLEYTGRMLQSFEIYFVLLIFGTSPGLLPFVYSFLILAFTSLFANLLFFFPLQLGGREGGFAMSTAQMGLTTEIGLFISLICRVREIVWTTIGLLLMKIGNNDNDK